MRTKKNDMGWVGLNERYGWVLQFKSLDVVGGPKFLAMVMCP